MAEFMKQLGLDFLMETEEQVRNLWGYIAQNGKAIAGYYGSHYLNMELGNAQLILRTIRNDREKRMEVVGMDTHSAGPCVWEVCLSGMNLARKDADLMERRCAVQRTGDGGGLAVVEIVNADVLPSFAEGEVVRLQMIAVPEYIDYYRDAEEYASAQQEQEDGKKLLLADGAMLPVGLMQNRNPESKAFESEEALDSLMLICGTVKSLYHGVLELGDQSYNAYLRCIIETQFGDLEIVHTLDAVQEDQREKIRVGATVYGMFTLSGDAAIYEYAQGMVLDETHDLAILRATLAGADPERLRYVLSENAMYLAGYNQKVYIGRDAIIHRLKEVLAKNDRCFARLATVISVEPGKGNLPYGEGKRCIVLSYGEERNYTTIAFAELDEEGRICRLETSEDSRYHFCLGERPEPQNPLEDFALPTSITEALLLRAHYHGIVGDAVTAENVLEDTEDAWMYENNVRRILRSMPKEGEEKTLGNLFGYLFAKAMEAEYTELRNADNFRTHLTVSYDPTDAWNGEIHTPLKPETHEKVVAAMKLGKQFARDFALFHPFGEPHDAQYDEDLHDALIVVQQLGKLYVPRKML